MVATELVRGHGGPPDGRLHLDIKVTGYSEHQRDDAIAAALDPAIGALRIDYAQWSPVPAPGHWVVAVVAPLPART